MVQDWFFLFQKMDSILVIITVSKAKLVYLMKLKQKNIAKKMQKKEVVVINGLFYWGALGQNFYGISAVLRTFIAESPLGPDSIS